MEMRHSEDAYLVTGNLKHFPTKPFVVTDHCIGCGLCQEICPCGAILISGGKPAWVKSKCVRCLGCLHRCPAQAIHWKTPEEDRGRYYNPRVES